MLAHPTDARGLQLALEAGVDVLVHTTLGASRGPSRYCLELPRYELEKEGVPQPVAFGGNRGHRRHRQGTK